MMMFSLNSRRNPAAGLRFPAEGAPAQDRALENMQDSICRRFFRYRKN